jgi:hypothetical protein
VRRVQISDQSRERLATLRDDQRSGVDALIAYMRGSAFGTAVLEPPISGKAEFTPSIEDPRHASVTIGKLRVQILRNCSEITVDVRRR